VKLKTVILRNFRCYHEEIRISFRDDITAFIGKNDAGKSTILEALEIFFNGDTIKMEQNDAYVESDCSDVTIGCVFTDLPTELVLDDTSTTTLEAEYLLNEEGDLELHKIWDCTKKNPKEEVVAICQHPSVEGADGLLQLANNQLKTRLKERDIDPSSVDQRVNPQLRSAIWKSFEHDDLQLSTREIPLNKADAKRVWE
jgi:putative ATP-dependent endonuclease of OLD family